MSTVNLDLDEPIQLLVDLYNSNFSDVPVTVVSRSGVDYQKGGYEWTKPPIIPVYGEAGKPRKGVTKLQNIPGNAEVLVYQVSENFTETDRQEDFADIVIRLSTDIYHSYSKFRLDKLYKELKRCMSQSKKSPGGNYHFIRFVDGKDFSNRNTGIFRIVFDIELVKVDDFIGHV